MSAETYQGPHQPVAELQPVATIIVGEEYGWAQQALDHGWMSESDVQAAITQLNIAAEAA